jgi:hypothetical protein
VLFPPDESQLSTAVSYASKTAASRRLLLTSNYLIFAAIVLIANMLYCKLAGISTVALDSGH